MDPDDDHLAVALRRDAAHIQPPADLAGRIQARLARRRRRPVWWLAAGLAAAVAVTSLVVRQDTVIAPVPPVAATAVDPQAEWAALVADAADVSRFLAGLLPDSGGPQG
jgi:hypothetical protein